MLPYFEEYSKYCENSASLRIYSVRLRKLNNIEENVLEMSAEQIADAIKAKETSMATLNAFYSAFEDYLMWFNRTYNEPIPDIYYQLKRLRKIASNICIDNYNEVIFSNFAELKKALLKAEDEYISIQEPELSEKRLDGLYLIQKKFNAYVVFIWNGLTEEEMLGLTLNDVSSIIIKKQIAVNNKIYYISDDEVDFLNEIYQFAIDIQKLDAYRKRGYKGDKQKHKAWTHDNLFNVNNVKYIKNLSFRALGKLSNLSLSKSTIRKSGIFHQMYNYEIENDYSFSQVHSDKVCAENFNVPISNSKACRLVSEYNNFRKSIEKAENKIEIK